MTGSQKKAATRSGVAASMASRRASGESHATLATSPTNGPYPAALAAMPARLVPATCMPWYALSRVMNMVRSVWPRSCQYRRAILAAVSMESEPPLVKNTRESGSGEKSATRSASSMAGRFETSPKVE